MDNVIFISYRRTPCVEFARTIHYALAKLGIDSFFDYTSCRDGHFNDNIYTAINQCKYVFLIMMDGALDTMWENSDDWVRKELEYAVEHGKVIIPIVKSGHLRKWPNKLPDKLEHLQTLQISKIDDEEYFEVSLKEVLKSRTTLLNNPPGQKIHLSKFISLGFNLTRFVVSYLRGKCGAYELEELSQTIDRTKITFPPIDLLSSQTMIEFIDKCEEAVADKFGDKARAAVDFGVIFHLSDIAKRSNLGEKFAHSYDEALLTAGRRLDLNEDFMEKSSGQMAYI